MTELLGGVVLMAAAFSAGWCLRDAIGLAPDEPAEEFDVVKPTTEKRVRDAA